MKFRFYIFYINLVLQRRSIHLYNGHDNRALIMPWSRLLINDFLKIIHDEQNWSVYFKNAYLKSLKLPVIVKRHLYTLIEILLRQCLGKVNSLSMVISRVCLVASCYITTWKYKALTWHIRLIWNKLIFGSWF